MNLSVDTFDTLKPSSQKVFMSFSFVQNTHSVIHHLNLFVSVKQVYEKKGAVGGRDDSNDATSMIYGDGSSLSLNPYITPKRASQVFRTL